MLGGSLTWKKNLYVLWIVQIFAQLSFGLCVPFTPYYLETLQPMTDVQLDLYTGLSSTLPAAAMAIASPIWGAISDRYGRKLMIIRAMGCASIIFIFMAMSHSVGIFLFLRMLQGVFTGSVPATMGFVSANTPEDKMSFAIGFITSSTYLGYALGPVVGGFFADWIGYEGCFILGAVLMAIGALMTVVLVYENPDTYGPRAKLSAGPLEGAGADVIADKKKKSKKGIAGVLTATAVMTLTVLLVVRIGRSVFTPFVAIFVRETLGTMEGATIWTGLVNGAMCVGTAVSAVTLARLGDKYDKFHFSQVLIIVSLVIGVVLARPLPLIVFIGVYALYYLMVGAIEPVLTSALTEVTAPDKRGMLFGLVGTINAAAMMIAPMIGSGISIAVSTTAILTVIPISMLISAALIMVEIKFNFRGKRKEN